MSFLPDYHYMLDVLANRRPARLPVYEHIIDATIIEKIFDVRLQGLLQGSPADQEEFFRHYCRFFREMTYDTVSFEVTITDLLPDHGAIFGGRPGPIQNRADFERYPWPELFERYWQTAEPQFATLVHALPPGMKALGGVGNGVLEISEDLVGFERLAYLQVDEPEVFAALYEKIGDLMLAIWTRFLDCFGDAFAVCRFGDDLGFKTSTLLSPGTIRQHVLPQYAAGDRAHQACRQTVLMALLRLHFPGDGRRDRLGDRRQALQRGLHCALRALDRVVRRPHRLVGRHRPGHSLPEEAGGGL